MAIDNLLATLRPPSKPSEVPTAEAWTPVERRLGVTLPHDYKEFIETYGSGSIGGFLWVFNPFSRNENLNLEKQLVIQAQVLVDLQSYGEVLPYKPFPENEGILPFGITDNGDLLFWKTSGNPDDWSVVVNEARSPEWESFELSMSEFLTAILQSQLNCSFFPENFPGLSPTFQAVP